MIYLVFFEINSIYKAISQKKHSKPYESYLTTDLRHLSNKKRIENNLNQKLFSIQ